jgi:predicted CxxxxCH...CXXCH cytochrome family protein
MRCHGGASGNAAPPRSVRGETKTSVPAVGAHQAHLVAGNLRGPIACDECHKVPTPENWRTHLGGGNASVEFVGTLGRSGGAIPSFDFATLRCSGTYCHGGTLSDPKATLTAPAWNVVDGSQRTCGSCHGIPPAQVSLGGQLLDHPQGGTDSKWCHLCHARTVDANGNIDLAGGHHIDGRFDVAVGGQCNGCHEAPPQTGAHLAHANPQAPPTAYGDTHTLQDVVGANASFTSYTSYDFGCGNCHAIDPTSHMTGGVDLSPAGAPAGSLKARNDPGAHYDPATGTCSGVYCHSTGQETPTFATTPGWTSGERTTCTSCHANPPRYANGGPGAADANSHVAFALEYDALGNPRFWEFGHYVGLPGPLHNSRHGGGMYGGSQDAAPMTCQTCHYETADPANTLPGRFFYLDTSGTYRLDLPGGDPARTDPGSSWWYSQCTTCHGSGLQPTGTGKVLPLRHVNGTRDVFFDRRPFLPDGYPVAVPPLAASAPPLRTYFVTDFVVSMNGPLLVSETNISPLASPSSGEGPVLSVSLGASSYDPATKTCSNVACHLARQYLVDTPAGALGDPSWKQSPLRWGENYVYLGSTCQSCHPM